ncbi:hypothetical protein FRA_36c08480 [Francisella sp. W12-1067]|nr:hypothetical protein FRA_36c08480 [Francisella sp. W12-1067]
MSIGFEVEGREIQLLCRNPHQYLASEHISSDEDYDYDFQLFEISLSQDLRIEVAIDHSARDIKTMIDRYPTAVISKLWPGELHKAIIEIKSTPDMNRKDSNSMVNVYETIADVFQFLEISYILEYTSFINDFKQQHSSSKTLSQGVALMRPVDKANAFIKDPNLKTHYSKRRTIKQWYEYLCGLSVNDNPLVPLLKEKGLSTIFPALESHSSTFQELCGRIKKWEINKDPDKDIAPKTDLTTSFTEAEEVLQDQYHWDNYIYDTINPCTVKYAADKNSWASKYSIQSNGSIPISHICNPAIFDGLKGLFGRSPFAYHSWCEIAKRINSFFLTSSSIFKAGTSIKPREMNRVKGFLFIFIWAVWCRNHYHDYLVNVRKFVIGEEKQYHPMLCKTHSVIAYYISLNHRDQDYIKQNASSLKSFICEVLSTPERKITPDTELGWSYFSKNDEQTTNNLDRQKIDKSIKVGAAFDAIISSDQEIQSLVTKYNDYDLELSEAVTILNKFNQGKWSGEFQDSLPIDDPISPISKTLSAVFYTTDEEIIKKSRINNPNPMYDKKGVINKVSNKILNQMDNRNPDRIKSKDIVFEARSHDCQPIQDLAGLKEYLKFLTDCWYKVQPDFKHSFYSFQYSAPFDGSLGQRCIYYPANPNDFDPTIINQKVLTGATALSSYSLVAEMDTAEMNAFGDSLPLRNIKTGFPWFKTSNKAAPKVFLQTFPPSNVNQKSTDSKQTFSQNNKKPFVVDNKIGLPQTGAKPQTKPQTKPQRFRF